MVYYKTMGTDQIMYCIVALILGMLMYHMLKNVCGCKNVVEGKHPQGCPANTISHDGSGSGPVCDASTLARDAASASTLARAAGESGQCNTGGIEGKCKAYALNSHLDDILNGLVSILQNSGEAAEKLEAAKSQNLLKLICDAECITTLKGEYDKCSPTERLNLSFDDPTILSLIPEILHVCQEDLNVGVAAVDCDGSWGEWGECSAECGGGSQSKSYTVSVEAANGGQPCPSELTNSQACNVQDCPPPAVQCHYYQGHTLNAQGVIRVPGATTGIGSFTCL